MTEKELKKLSRLEIFEILLEESKENERLRQELDKKNEEFLSKMDINSLITVDRMNLAIEKLESLVQEMEKNTEKASEIKEDASAVATSKETAVLDDATRNAIVADRKLFLRMLNFYSGNKIAMALLPNELQNEVKARLRGITDARK